MIELPEAATNARLVRETLQGKKIAGVIANATPHKFAWYAGDPAEYPQKLTGKTIVGAEYFGNHVEIRAEELRVAISTPMRYHAKGDARPEKHQLLLDFEDGSALSCTIQMWGSLLCLKPDEVPWMRDYPYAKERPSPLSKEFDARYFRSLWDENTPKLSAKTFLATEQRIPGLGNGVLQDILWTAKVNPKQKMGELKDSEVEGMFAAVKQVLGEMTAKGGRDTESDLFGRAGGYRTILSKNTQGGPCPSCGEKIQKETYLGGAVYYCPGCQKL
jgi:formamidopyrimidine-DNA glycosylase